MGFEPHQAESRAETVNKFKDRMEKSLEEAKAALAKAKDDMTRYYNQRRHLCQNIMLEIEYSWMPPTLIPLDPFRSLLTATLAPMWSNEE